MTSILIYGVIILGVLTLIQLVRVFELSAKLKGQASELPTETENRNQARMMIPLVVVFFAFFGWLLWDNWDKMLPVAASAHGEGLDQLLNFNFLMIIIVFVITHIVLFYFAYKYAYKEGRKVAYFTHSNKLELIWTIVPAFFLAIVIIYGLTSWKNIMLDDAPEDSLNIELYSKQFDWTARYAGKDTKLGSANYNMINLNSGNALGVITEKSLQDQFAEIDKAISKQRVKIDEEYAMKQGVENPIVYPEGTELYDITFEEIERLKRHRGRVVNLDQQKDSLYIQNGEDDVIVKGTFYLPVNRPVHMQFRSQDVIHSAYLPHFRVQMNTVPGMITEFNFLPNKTTAEMREITGKEDFEFYLLCNKICGAAHYNMKMVVKVVSEDEYNDWMDKQKQFDGNLVVPKVEEDAPAEETADADVDEAGDADAADDQAADESENAGI